MPNNNPDILTLITMLLVSIASGVVSILNKIAQGRAYDVVWVTSEFIAAILCGYLAYDTYAKIASDLPAWMGLPMFVSASAFVGGKLLRTLGDFVSTNLERFSGVKGDDK